jgi:type IV pilus assembly protein PilM
VALKFIKGLFGPKSPETGALDIGSNTIKLCQVMGTMSNLQLFRFVTCSTPAAAIKDGAIMESSSLGEAIREMIAENNLTCKKVVTSVAGQQVVIRPIPMPRMPSKELHQAIQFEAERYLPYSVTEAQVSGSIISEDSGDGKNMEVLLIAVPKEITEKTKLVISAAGVETGAIDIEPLAIYRCLKFTLDPADLERTFALINLGAATTSISIFKSGTLRHCRTVSVAGNSFTKAIGQSLNLSFEEAEQIKREKGVIKVDTDPNPLPPTAMRIFNVIDPVLNELVTELQRSFDYYRSRYRGETIEAVILSGGTARFKNLDAYLSSKLGVRCEVANPFRRMQITRAQEASTESLADLAPMAAVVIGLALYEVKS